MPRRRRARARHRWPPRQRRAATCAARSPRLAEIRIEEEIRQGRVPVVCLLDAAQELGADDAAPAPDHCDLPEIETPLLLGGRCRENAEALRVGADLRGIEGVVHRRGELIDVSAEALRGSVDEARGGNALVLHRGDAARKDSLGDRRCGHPEIQRRLGRPFPRPLLTRPIEDDLHHRLSRLRVAAAEDIRGDLNEEGIEVSLVPAAEQVAHLVVAHAEQVLHDEVGLGDELHVPVLDPVVDHLHVMAGPVSPDVGAAGLAVDLRGNIAQDPARPSYASRWPPGMMLGPFSAPSSPADAGAR